MTTPPVETFTPLSLTDARRLLWGSRGARARTVILTDKLRHATAPLDVRGPVFLPGARPLLVDVTGGFQRLRIANGFVDVQLSAGVLAHIRVEGHAGPVLLRVAPDVRLQLSGPGADAVKLVGDSEAIAGIRRVAI